MTGPCKIERVIKNGNLLRSLDGNHFSHGQIFEDCGFQLIDPFNELTNSSSKHSTN